MECGEVMIEKLLIKPVGITMTMRADCPVCKKKICEAKYAEFGDGDALHKYNIKRDKWRDTIRECPFCGVQFKRRKSVEKRLVWAKAGKDMAAKAKNGIFTVFKWGKGYRWSFRYYSENTPRAGDTGYAMCKEVAERACEKHKEWMV